MIIDPKSAAAQRMIDFLTERIVQKGRALEKPGKPIEETEFLRGQIKAYRVVVEAILEPSKIEENDESSG